jgi:GT2 family glycosyltransferase
MFNRIGLFDEDYFLYMEDVDLCLRAQLSGYKFWFEPKAKIYHIRMATSSKNMEFTECISFRNMTMTIIKNYPVSLLYRNWWKILLVNLNTIFYLGRKGYLKRTLQSEWYILTHLKPLLEKRKKIQQMKRTSDQYIIENIRPKKVTFYGLLK